MSKIREYINQFFPYIMYTFAAFWYEGDNTKYHEHLGIGSVLAIYYGKIISKIFLSLVLSSTMLIILRLLYRRSDSRTAHLIFVHFAGIYVVRVMSYHRLKYWQSLVLGGISTITLLVFRILASGTSCAYNFIRSKRLSRTTIISTEQSPIASIVEHSFEVNPTNNLQNPQVQTIPKYVHHETGERMNVTYESSPNISNSEIQRNSTVAQNEMNPTNPADGMGDFNSKQILANTNENSMKVNTEMKQFEARGDEIALATNNDPIGDKRLEVVRSDSDLTVDPLSISSENVTPSSVPCLVREFRTRRTVYNTPEPPRKTKKKKSPASKK